MHAGDIRSRLVRLIPPADPGSPLDAIRNLLAYRLPAKCTEQEARDQWRDIVEGRSRLWTGIPNDRKEMIRGMSVLLDDAHMLVLTCATAFLVHFEHEILSRAHKNFSFVNGRSVVLRSQPKGKVLNEKLQHRQLLPIRRASILPFPALRHLLVLFDYQQPGQHPTCHCDQPYCHDCSRAGEMVVFLVCVTSTDLHTVAGERRAVGWSMRDIPSRPTTSWHQYLFGRESSITS